MSEDVLRTFHPGPGARRRRRVFRGKGGLLARLIPILLLAALIWVLWATRDTHSMGELIPADQAYEIYLGDLLRDRAHIAQSRVWQLAPAESPLAAIPAQLSDNFGLPEWLLNNLIVGLCHVSGNDLDNFGDLLFATRMSRIGCLAERLHGFFPGVEDDLAGGLHLRTLPGLKLYYAVRGRILLLSRSRDALIHALTLPPSEALGESALQQGLREMGGQELAARLRLDENDPAGDVFSSVQIATQLDADTARATLEAVLRPEWRERLADLLEGSSPAELKLPPEGLLVLSANFGRSLPALWNGIAEATGRHVEMNALLEMLAENIGGDTPMLIEAVAQVAGELGPGIRFAWLGVDLNAMIPAPELAFWFDVAGSAIPELLALIPPPPAEMPAWASYPRYHPETGAVHIPMIDGPSLEPTFVMHGGALMASSSHAAAERLLALPNTGERLGQPGNLFLRLRPQPAAEAIIQAGLEVADLGIIRGHDAASFHEAAEPWRTAARQMDEIAALASHQNGEIRLDIRLTIAQQP